MLQYDVARFLAEPEDSITPFVVILQSPAVPSRETCIVAPLRRPGLAAVSLLHPVWRRTGDPWLILMDRMAAVYIRDLGEVIGSAADAEWAIKSALDRLFFGT